MENVPLNHNLSSRYFSYLQNEPMANSEQVANRPLHSQSYQKGMLITGSDCQDGTKAMNLLYEFRSVCFHINMFYVLFPEGKCRQQERKGHM